MYPRNLSLARAQLGLRSSHQGPQGVGAVFPTFAMRPMIAAAGHPSAAMVAHPSVPSAAHLVAPTTGARPAMNVSDRAYWAKIYMSISIPVDSTEQEPNGILPGATLQIKSSSQVTVWITDFTIDTDEPSQFVVTQLKISRVDYIGGSGGIPASRFRQNSVRPQLNNEILNGGSFALVEVKNIDKNATLDFHGTFDGLDLSKPMAQSL